MWESWAQNKLPLQNHSDSDWALAETARQHAAEYTYFVLSSSCLQRDIPTCPPEHNMHIMKKQFLPVFIYGP